MRYLRQLVLIFSFGLISVSLLAQPDPNNPPDDGTGFDPNCDPMIPLCECPSTANIPPCPVDGGVIALLAAGVGLGIKRMRDVKKQLVAKEI